MEIQSDRAQVVDDREPVPVPVPVTTQAALAAPLPAPMEVPAPPAVAGAAHGVETVSTSRTSGFAPAALVAGAGAVVLLLVGGITSVRAGIDGSLDEPIIQVGGYSATALLGILEVVFGVVLLSAALYRSQRAVLFLGIAGGVLALIAVFQPSPDEGPLAIERGLAVRFALIMGAIVVAALLPTVRLRSVVRRTSDVT